jgi:hypothetical protein
LQTLELDLFKNLFQSLGACLGGEMVQPKENVVCDGHMRPESGTLKDKTDPTLVGRHSPASFAHQATIKVDLTFIGKFKTGD